MLKLQDYALGEALSEGPEPRVRRAIHQPSGERLLVKLPDSATASLRIVGRLVHEYRILGRLAHIPGVARARGLSQQGGQAALWLEDPGLRSLSSVLAERGPLPLDAALRLARELCRVLKSVHAVGIVHKDIKPHSVLIDESCTQVCLVDFGIASELAQEATEASVPEALEGTLAYISPEQTGRTARGLDSRTDLYSLGVLLFEALSGRRPFLEWDALALVHAHLAKAPPPLDSLVPGLPSTMARIVERCLEKPPEKRYQTAQGLAADLDRCAHLLQERGQIDPFVLGQKDFSPKLQLPQTLVSREKEVQEVTAAFERAANGAVEVLLLSGPSGVGKTALVRSVYQEIAQAGRGLLLSGKHDQLGRSVPYAALAQAFGGLMSSLAASPKPVFEVWRARLGRALGPLARVIADVVPELEWLLGPLPPVPVVPTEMTYNRIKLSWIEFVRAVTDASPPLVLFLDDLQWVDPASLELLKTLLTDVGRKNLLVIAAFRDNEVEAGHPLWTLIEAVAKSGIATPRLTVGALDLPSVQMWLAVTLSAEPERVRRLAETLFEKTRGNPFFLGQLLLELYRQKRVRRNLEDGQWQWDQDAVERAAVTDNVVELMRSKVVELPDRTQQLLGQAACAGHSFSLGELIVLTGLDPSQVAQELWSALLAGLLIPSDGQYREAQALAQAPQSAKLDARYRFLHDRVQQAFYERVAEEQRARTHLQIGRRLQKMFEQQGGSNQKQLELVRQLNLGAGALETGAERKELARLDLQAAKAAKANGSYRLQAALVEQAQLLLGEQAWHEEPQLSVELLLERIEADFMLREFEQVHKQAQALLALPLPALPRLAAQELRVRTCLAAGQYGEGERLGLAALAEQGITYPETNDARIALALELITECDAWLDRHPERFGAMPADSSPEHLLCDALEAAMMLCAGLGSGPALAVLSMVRNVKQATERGALTPVTPLFITELGSAKAALLGEYQGGVRWTREGEQAATRLASPMFPECSFLCGVSTVYELPAEQSRKYYQAALRVATASGSFQGTGWGLLGELFYADFWPGRPLEQVAETELAQRDKMTRAGDAVGQHSMALLASYTTFVRTPHSSRAAPDGDWLTASSRSFLALGDGIVAELARIQEAHLFLAFGEASRALERAEEAERFSPIIYALPPVTDIPLWRGLSAAKCWSPTLAQPEQTALSATLTRSIERFRYFAKGCAENFLHKLRLLEAEQARLHGQIAEAMAKYDEAITLARREGFLHIEALASQFCAEFYLAAGRERIAALYLQEARAAYSRWGALALVAHLEAKYSRLFQSSAPAAGADRAAPTLITDTTGNAQLDVGTVVRAAQALSSELDPARVVGRLMELVLQTAGAQQGVLVLNAGDVLSVVARLSVEGARIETGLPEPLAHSLGVAATVVEFVARSREPVVLSDAHSDKQFGSDPYLTQHAVRSLLALPLTHQGRLVGVLYLEHRDAPSAFPPARVALLSVLASQAAIAVENARLYSNVEAQVRALQARNQEIVQLNEELRRQIEQRSRRFMDTLLAQDPSAPTNTALQTGGLLGECYRVVRLIGEGGMGVVYEVQRTTDGRHLAAKVLRSRPDRNALRRFAREAQILARLNHPNLISIVDLDVTSDGGLYIVMELVSGSSLWQQRARFGDVRWGLGVLRQVAQALAVLHAQSVVHRDLKPENILVMTAASETEPVVKLADFGVSIMLDEAPDASQLLASGRQEGKADGPMEGRVSWGPPAALQRSAQQSVVTQDGPDRAPIGIANTELGRAMVEAPGRVARTLLPAAASDAPDRRRQLLTQTGVIIGTPLYMAPELLHGSKNAQPPSDVFSLGVIAFELLTGSMPFERLPVLSAAAGETLVVSPRLRQCRGLSPSLAELLERCLALDPAQRPEAQQLAALLTNSGADPLLSAAGGVGGAR